MRRRRKGNPIPPAILLPAMLLLLCAGCAGRGGALRFAEANRSIDVFGIQLGSDADWVAIEGDVASEEPCLKGYVRIFDSLEIAIGYGRDRRIRKISTRNRRTRAFGISPGDSFRDAKASIVRAGFREAETPHRFVGGGLTATLLVDESDTVFGITVETSNESP